MDHSPIITDAQARDLEAMIDPPPPPPRRRGIGERVSEVATGTALLAVVGSWVAFACWGAWWIVRRVLG